eukprot:7833206-Karenia_brevis.AAC.1
MRCVLPKVILQENVASFGIREMQELLGDLYILILVRVNPVTEGWASYRDRQVIIFVVKVWIYAVIRNDAEPIPCSPKAVVKAFAI